MTQETAAAPTKKAKGPQFNIERIYIKDVSFETPLGAETFNTEWKPKVDLDLNNKSTPLGDDLYEVVLTLTVTARKKDSETAYYLVEVQQAGIFRIANLPEEELKRALATFAPSTLFPYIRETIDSLLLKANFPPLMLAPLNFDALLMAAINQQQKRETAPSPTIQ